MRVHARKRDKKLFGIQCLSKALEYVLKDKEGIVIDVFEDTIVVVWNDVQKGGIHVAVTKMSDLDISDSNTLVIGQMIRMKGER